MPSGLLARGAFAWRPGDVLLVGLLLRRVPRPGRGGRRRRTGAVRRRDGERRLDARLARRRPGPRLGAEPARRHAHAGVLRRRRRRRSACGRRSRPTPALDAALRRLPDELERTIARARAWVDEHRARSTRRPRSSSAADPAGRPRSRPRCCSRRSPAIPAEGVETREGATSAMMALRPGRARAEPAGRRGDDPLLAEAEEICAGQGATVLRAPGGETADRGSPRCRRSPPPPRSAPASASTRGLDVDRPAWTDAYYRVARRSRHEPRSRRDRLRQRLRRAVPGDDRAAARRGARARERGVRRRRREAAGRGGALRRRPRSARARRGDRRRPASTSCSC